MTVDLYPDERIDELQRNGYRIIQNKNMFCFGMDAVLLSGFAAAGKGERVLDLGTGTGIIPILMEAKTDAEHFTGLELQEDAARMAARSVALNGLEGKIDIVTGDLCRAHEIFGRAVFDVVTSNPPYIAESHGLKNPEEPKAIARHEIRCSFDDVARETAAVLKPGGRFYLVHRVRRLVEIIETLRAYKLEPKRLRAVHSYRDTEAVMVLIEAVRGGGPQLVMEAPLIIYEEPGRYTSEIYDIYGY